MAQASVVGRWVWVAVLVAGAALFEIVRIAMATTNNINYAPSLILLGAATIPAAFVAFVAGRRSSVDRSPITANAAALVPSPVALAGTALVAGVIAVVAAGLVEYETLQRLDTLPIAAVALTEEIAKLLVPAVLLIAAPQWRREPVNGLVLGVAAGAGFAVLETMGYAITTLVRSHADLVAIDATLLHRGLLAPAAHMAWTGLTAAVLWHSVAQRWRPWAVAEFAAALVVAVSLHTCWDAIGGLVCYVALGVAAFAILLAVTDHLTVRHPGPAPALTSECGP